MPTFPTFTYFTSRAEAQDIANRNREHDATWSFDVEPVGTLYVIAVSDEDGVKLGLL